MILKISFSQSESEQQDPEYGFEEVEKSFTSFTKTKEFEFYHNSKDILKELKYIALNSNYTKLFTSKNELGIFLV